MLDIPCKEQIQLNCEGFIASAGEFSERKMTRASSKINHRDWRALFAGQINDLPCHLENDARRFDDFVCHLEDQQNSFADLLCRLGDKQNRFADRLRRLEDYQNHFADLLRRLED